MPPPAGVPVKRGRGRPRKNPDAPVLKRPVGRPRKVPLEDNETSPERKKSKNASNNPSFAKQGKATKRASSDDANHKILKKKQKQVAIDPGEDTDREVEELTATGKGGRRKGKALRIPPAFPDKDPYDFDAMPSSDLQALPDLRLKRKRRKSKGFDFELESRRKKKKKKKPSTPEDRYVV